MMSKKKETYYVVTFREPVEGKIQTLKARAVTDSTLGMSFVSISDFIFDTDSLVVNPKEETLKQRFEDVKALHLSIYTILSIEEVGKTHQGLKFKKDKSNLVVLPGKESPVKSDK
jgi:hypothetical protein